MIRTSILGRRYAQAYFDLADAAGEVAGWRKELASVVEVLDNPEVALAVRNPRLPLAQRVRLVLDLLDGASEPARNLARLLIERRRTGLGAEIAAAYDELADRASGVLRALVITAVPLSDRQQRELSRALSQRFGRTVQPQLQQDAEIIGGVVVRVGDRVIDDSVRTHLQQLQAALA